MYSSVALKFHYRFYFLLICVSWLLCMGSLVRAALVIDDFSISQSAQNGETNTVSDPSILGGYRDLDTCYYFKADINQTVSQQLYCVSNPKTGSYVNIYYDGQGAYNYNGLGNMDLTGGGQYTGFELSFTNINTTGGQIGIEVYQEGKDWGWLGYDLTNETQTLFFAFDDFMLNLPCASSLDGDIVAASNLFDFTDVGFLRLYISLAAGGSCTMDSFNVVPEPATMLLVLGGLFLRKRK